MTLKPLNFPQKMGLLNRKLKFLIPIQKRPERICKRNGHRTEDFAGDSAKCTEIPAP